MSPIAARDTLVLGTDGLFDNLSVDEVVDIARLGPIGEAADRLAELSQERMVNPTGQLPSKPDDMSLIVYRPQRMRRTERVPRST